MIAVQALEPESLAEWDAYVLSRPGTHFAQRTAWRSLVGEFFPVEARWWQARDEHDRIVGILPVFRGRNALFSSPGGLVADSTDAAVALLERAGGEVARDRLLWLEMRDQSAAWPDRKSVV